MMDFMQNLERAETTSKRRHDGRDFQGSSYLSRPSTYKKARRTGDRGGRSRPGYSRSQGEKGDRSYVPFRGKGRSRDYPGRGRGRQDKPRGRHVGRRHDDERCRNKPQREREREDKSRPKRDRDGDMHLAESEQQQSVVESEESPSPSPSQEESGGSDENSDCLDTQYHVDVGDTGKSLKSLVLDSGLRDDIFETALEEEADDRACTLPQEEAAYHTGLKGGDEAEATADSGEESIPSEEEEKADN